MKSVVIAIPCFNEEEALPHLMKELQKTRDKLTEKYRLDVLLINDGSIDNTQSLIENMASKYEGVYYIQFASNAGHQSAIRAGIDASTSYDALIMLDADLQHPPSLIPQMLNEWEGGTKIVQMVRDDRMNDVGLFKYATSKMYYKLINGMSNLKLDYGASDFRLIDNVVIKVIASSPEKDLFLRGYLSWLPIEKTSLKYKPQKRVAGSSKYSFKKMLKLAYEGVLQFSEKPLLIAAGLGVVLALISFIYGLIIIIQRLTGTHTVSGWTSLMVTVLFCFGINFILIGIVGAYLTHAVRLEKQRPSYIIESKKIPKI